MASAAVAVEAVASVAAEAVAEEADRSQLVLTDSMAVVELAIEWAQTVGLHSSVVDTIDQTAADQRLQRVDA